MTIIYSINARDNVIFDLIEDLIDYSDFAGPMFKQLLEILNKKGIDYSDFRGALTPSVKKREVVFIFDTLMIENSCYGGEIFDKLIPIIKEYKKSTFSCKVGDYILAHDKINKSTVIEILFKDLNRSKFNLVNIEYADPRSYFLVYFNNQSEKMIQNFHEKLELYTPYVGYMDSTFTSSFKRYLPYILPSYFIINKNKILLAIPSDYGENEWNVYGFNDNGYQVIGIIDYLSDIFLDYKIDVDYYPDNEFDEKISLSFLSEVPILLKDLDINIPDDKFEYIRKNKLHALKKSGLSELSKKELENIIKYKIKESKIFNLEIMESFNVLKFDILVEFYDAKGIPNKNLIALKYSKENKQLSLITFY